MKNRKHQTEDPYEMQSAPRSGMSVFTGMLIGGLVGAGVALLMAPRSGEETRAEIRNKAIEYRDRTLDAVNETISQGRSRVGELKEDVLGTAEDLKRRGKQTTAQQLDNVARAAESAKSRVQEY